MFLHQVGIGFGIESVSDLKNGSAASSAASAYY